MWIRKVRHGGLIALLSLLMVSTNVTEVVEWSDFEGVNSWAVGLKSEAGYALSWLEDPTRFVVDIVHG